MISRRKQIAILSTVNAFVLMAIGKCLASVGWAEQQWALVVVGVAIFLCGVRSLWTAVVFFKDRKASAA